MTIGRVIGRDYEKSREKKTIEDGLEIERMGKWTIQKEKEQV